VDISNLRAVLTCCLLSAACILSAQDKVKFTGYLQPQFQYGEQYSTLKVGTENHEKDKSFNRIGIRRGRFNLIYTETYGSLAVQIDATERGVLLKNAILTMKDIWWKTSYLSAGVFEPPFGKEVDYSSAKRESPESSLLFQTLFPEERDLGALIRLRPAESSPLHFLFLDAAVVAGNGAKMETDSRKDVILHLYYSRQAGSLFLVEGGLSYYNGGVYQGTSKVFRMDKSTNGFVMDDAAVNLGRFAKREYKGIDVQVYMLNDAWKRQIRAELIAGTQPGSIGSSVSHNASTLPTHDTYLRPFLGGYAIFVQRIAATPFSAVAKYEWYDPNTAVAGDELGLKGTTATDVRRNTLGMGMLWEPGEHFRLQSYFEFNRNEQSANLAGYETDRKDNVLTVRLQYRF